MFSNLTGTQGSGTAAFGQPGGQPSPFSGSLATPKTTAAGLFATPAIAAPLGGLFSTASSAPAFSFTQAPASSAPATGFSVFGSSGSGTATSASPFTFAKSANVFGSTAVPTFGSTPTSFGAQAPSAPATAYLTGSTTFGGLTGAAQSVQQTQQSALQEATSIAAAVKVPSIFLDERDKILATFNQIQAKFGVGKGFHAQSGQPVIFTPENPFCKFRAIAYNALPKNRPEDGLVSLLVSKPADEVKAATPSFSEMLHRDVVKAPNLSVVVEFIGDFGTNQCRVIIYVLEKSLSGARRRLTSTELAQALSQPACKNALSNLGVIGIAELAEMNKTILEHYLSTPPSGMDPLLWDQAHADNPDPQRLAPVVLLGFDDLHARLRFQQNVQEGHMAYLELMTRQANELNKKCFATRAKVTELRLKQQDIAHRVLKVMATFEVNRKLGLAIQSDEETLKASLEELAAEIEVLTRGRLSELLLSARTAEATADSVQMSTKGEDVVPEDLQKLLGEQHKAIAYLTKVIKDDMKTLEDIRKSLITANT